MYSFKVKNMNIDGDLEEKVSQCVDPDCSWMSYTDKNHPNSQIIAIISSAKPFPECLSFVAFDNIKHKDIKLEPKKCLDFFEINKNIEDIKEASYAEKTTEIDPATIISSNINSDSEYVYDDRAQKAVILDASTATVSIIDTNDISKIIKKYLQSIKKER